jgi:hydrogenase-4 membrane subunit HyfE
MYLNYISDRRKLGYAVLKDKECDEKLIAIFNCDSIILRSILVRPEFLNRSCKKSKHKIKEFYSVRMAGFIIITSVIIAVNSSFTVFFTCIATDCYSKFNSFTSSF